jgi:hypothetical protein
MKTAFELYFQIVGIAATGVIVLFAALTIYYCLRYDEPQDGYRKDLCTYCGRLIPVDAPVDKDGRCYECRKGVDMLV